MNGTVQRGLQGGLDLELYKCFHRLRFVGLFTSFSNISFIGMGAFNLHTLGGGKILSSSGVKGDT